MEFKAPMSVSLLRQNASSHILRSKITSSVNKVGYFARSLWLFTFSDLKTIVGPTTAFALLQGMGSSSFEIQHAQTASSIFAPGRILMIVFWTWINLLAFTVDNQRQLDAIEEDAYNKPWRPLPAKRMTPEQATILSWILYPTTVLVSIPLGTHCQSLALVFLGLWHNVLGGGDNSWVTRNFLNGCGFVCYLSGALQILLQQHVLLNSKLCAWLVTIGCIVFTTIHTQDMYDQEGDSQRGRKTAPLVLGDGFARWTIAFPVIFWSLFCPCFWSVPIFGLLGPLPLGGLIAWRTISKRTVKEDRTTFKYWNLWLVCLYALPVAHSLST